MGGALKEFYSHLVYTLYSSLWPPYGIWQAIIFFALWFLSSSSSIFFPRLISAVAEWMSTILLYTWCGPNANLECRSAMYCTRLAEKYRTENSSKIAISALSDNFVGLYLRD